MRDARHFAVIALLQCVAISLLTALLLTQEVRMVGIRTELSELKRLQLSTEVEIALARTQLRQLLQDKPLANDPKVAETRAARIP